MSEDSSPEKFSLSIDNKDLMSDSSNEATVNRVGVVVGKGERQRYAGEYISKKYRSKELRDKNYSHYLFLKENGFPVPLTMRPQGDDELLVTDLTIGGEKFVYSTNTIAEGEQIDYLRGVHITNRDELKHQLQTIAKRADRLGIGISTDAPFLLVDKKGQGEIILGDLGAGIMTDSEEMKEFVFENNRESMSSFWKSINAAFTEGSYFPIDDPLYPIDYSLAA